MDFSLCAYKIQLWPFLPAQNLTAVFMKKHAIHNLTSAQFGKTVTYFKVCSESQRWCVLQLHHLKRGSVRNVSKSSNKKKMVKLQCTTLTLCFLPKVGHFKRRLRNDSLLEVASSGKLRNCSLVTSAVGWVKYLSVSKTTRNPCFISW